MRTSQVRRGAHRIRGRQVFDNGVRDIDEGLEALGVLRDAVGLVGTVSVVVEPT